MSDRRIGVNGLVAALLVLTGCESATTPDSTRSPTSQTPKAWAEPSSPFTPIGEPTGDSFAKKRERLRRQLRHHQMVVDFLDHDAEVLRGASSLDALTLDQVLAGLAGFDLAADDDVYTVRLTSLVAGRHLADGTFDPLFDHRLGWMVRRHHRMEAVGCDQMDSHDSCRRCAEFYDDLYFFVPSLRRNANPYGALLPTEVTIGTEAAEAANHGMKLCH